MPCGVVKWYNQQKGYGFIQPDDGGADLFVHAAEVEAAGLETLLDGARVCYEIKTAHGRKAATKLRVQKDFWGPIFRNLFRRSPTKLS
ncbi:MAG: cold-shock protein [Parvularculaceae bacterium]